MTRTGVVALLLAAVLAAGCEVPTNDEPVELSGPFARLETTTTTPVTTPEAPGTSKDAVVYLLQTVDETTTLEPVTRSVDIDAGIQQILNNLISQPPTEPGLETAIPSGAELLSAERAEGDPDRLIVDVRGLFGDQGPQGVRLRNALAQIVWTATVPSLGINEVVFRSNGQPADALVDDLQSTSDPVDRCDYRQSGDDLDRRCADQG